MKVFVSHYWVLRRELSKLKCCRSATWPSQPYISRTDHHLRCSSLPITQKLIHRSQSLENSNGRSRKLFWLSRLALHSFYDDTKMSKLIREPRSDFLFIAVLSSFPIRLIRLACLTYIKKTKLTSKTHIILGCSPVWFPQVLVAQPGEMREWFAKCGNQSV